MDDVTGREDLSLALGELLTRIGNRYAVARSAHERRYLAREMLSGIALSLDGLGISTPWPKMRARAPIYDLVHMLTDLNNGREHPWGKPSRVGGSSIDSAAKRELRLWSLAVMRILLNGGHREGEAYDLVARALTKAGFEGRQSKGKPFPSGTVKRWWRAYINSDGALADRVESAAAVFWIQRPCEHAASVLLCEQDQGKPCRSLKQASVAAVDQRGLLQLLMDRFRSVESG